MLDVQTSLLEKFTHFHWHVPKNLSQNAPIFITCTYYLIGSVQPGTATEFLAANIFQPISGQHCLLRHPSGRYAQRNQSRNQKCLGTSYRSTATDRDKNVMISVRDCVQTIKREWVSECVRESVSEWVSECVRESVSQWVYMWWLFSFLL